MSNNPNRRAGRIYFKVDGTQYDAKGSFSYNLGADKRDGIVGADGVHGYKAMPQVPFIEGAVTDRPDMDLKSVLELDGVTVTLELANSKTIVLRNAGGPVKEPAAQKRPKFRSVSKVLAPRR